MEEKGDRKNRVMPSEEACMKMTNFYKVLGDGTRLKIIFLLLQGELCVKDIYTELGTNTSMISHQLRQMKSAGIVKYRREGKKVIYSLSDEHVEKIINISLEHVSHE